MLLPQPRPTECATGRSLYFTCRITRRWGNVIVALPVNFCKFDRFSSTLNIEHLRCGHRRYYDPMQPFSPTLRTLRRLRTLIRSLAIPIAGALVLVAILAI